MKEKTPNLRAALKKEGVAEDIAHYWSVEKPRHAPPLDPDKVWIQQPEGHYSTEDK